LPSKKEIKQIVSTVYAHRNECTTYKAAYSIVQDRLFILQQKYSQNYQNN